MRRGAALALATSAGLPIAFFFVLAPLLTDGPGGLLHPERLASFALSFAVYAAAGFLVGLLRPRDLLAAALLAAAAAIVVAAYVPRESETAGLAVAYLALAAGGSLLGAWLAGLRVRPEGR